MTITLFAQPYDIHATGFYFKSAEEYAEHANKLTNDYGDPVEEFEIQFIDGDDLDAALAKAIGLDQCNVFAFLDVAERWQDWEKKSVILAVGECGYEFDALVNPDDYDIDIYHLESLRELAELFVEDGLYGDIPESLQFYIDYDAIARDLAVEYTEITIAGGRYVYACR